MNIIKSAILFVIVSLLIQNFSYSQTEEKKIPSPEERAQKRSEFLTKKLSLTESQKNSVYEIMLSHAQQMDQARETYASEKDKFKTTGKEIRTSTDNKLQSVFTEEQNTTYNEMKQKHMEKRKHCKHNKKQKKSKN